MRPGGAHRREWFHNVDGTDTRIVPSGTKPQGAIRPVASNRDRRDLS
jgi:hypothetical protein